MNNKSLPSELQFAINLMAGCAAITTRVQKEHIDVQNKADRSPVTIADYAVQAYVAQAIWEMFPQDALVGEESSALLSQDEALLTAVTHQVRQLLPKTTPELICDWIDHGQGQPRGRYWVLDPVDGTKGFLRRMQYANALALIEDGEVILGVVGCPALEYKQQTGAMAYASIGQGAWWRSYHPAAESFPLHVSSVKQLSQSRILRSYEDSHTDAARIEKFSQLAGINTEPVRMDSQAKYFRLAAGQAELSMRLLSADRQDYREFIWDQAPGYRVVLEAGGKITDSSGAPLDFSTGRRLTNNHGILATNGWIHEEALSTLRRT